VTPTPRCSIVIPVHGRAGLTRRCLDALLAEPELVRGEAEAIVVDDGSPDDTRALLARYGDAIRVHARDAAGGFATACNEGAVLARGELLLLLNNDTLGEPGWLGALLAAADAHPADVVLGAKLLFPDGSVQHAGVTIGRDELPRNLYAGFPGDHPAACRSRAVQAVTGACMLIRRAAWEQAGGFDAGYRNGLEDVDLCLRLGALGHGVRCVHDSVLVHLESPTRGRRSPDIDAGVARYRARWGGRVRPDDLDHYAADGLLRVHYGDLHPVRLTVSAELATVNDRGDERERLLARRGAQVAALLRETVRQSAELTCLAGAEAGVSPVLGYRALVERVRRVVGEAIPVGETVAVVSRGDDELVDLGERTGWHFPQDEEGEYAGHHPADSAAAIAQLEALRARGARWLVVPSTASWWLEHYDGLARHLAERAALTTADQDTCLVYALAGVEDGEPGFALATGGDADGADR